jgi:hypothetical protein
MLNLPGISKELNLNIIGKQVPQISTEIFGTSSNFRELFTLTGISPMDPQKAIDQTGIVKEIDKLQKQAGVVGTKALETFSLLKKQVADVIKIDWLN